MITYSQLGKNGRLGNQMFQYAALFSVGLTRGFEIGIPKGTKLSEVFQIPNAIQLKDIRVNKLYKEKDFLFDPSIFLIPDECDILGYFQSGNYFNLCKEAILKEFKFKKDIEEKSNLFLTKFSGKDLCSLHIRRGDYKNLSNYHTNLGSEYYQHAIKVVNDNIKNKHFLVFSDEPEWCKKNLSGDDFTIIDIFDDAVEMCMMSKCKVHIISNSSFSWWGSYLSNSPAVIAPKSWFGPEGPKNWETIYERGWIVI